MRALRVLCCAGVAALALGSTAAAACRTSKIGDIPLELAGPRALVPAAVNGAPVKLIVDTGAFFSALPAEVAEQQKLRAHFTAETEALQGAVSQVYDRVAEVRQFELAGATYTNIDFLIHPPTASGSTESAGLLGNNFLRAADLELDFANGLIRFFKSEGCERTDMAYWAGALPASLLEAERGDKMIIGEIKVNGVAMQALFDTGAPRTILTTTAANRAGIPYRAAEQADAVAGLGEGATASWIAPIKTVQIDDEVISDTKLQVANLTIPADLLVGADFFLAHRIYLSKDNNRLFFTYNGGPVFDRRRWEDDGSGKRRRTIGRETVATSSARSPDGKPTTPGAFARRAAGKAARGDYVGAEADYGFALALAPQDVAVLRHRAAVRRAQGDRSGARADLDAAASIAPGDAVVRYGRAALRAEQGDSAGAQADLQAVAAKMTPEDDAQLKLAAAYSEADLPEGAVAHLGLWLAHHPKDARVATARNSRCWAGALAGRELGQASEDCAIALRLSPNNLAFLDSRGLVNLRTGDLDGAIRDYDRVLAKDSKLAWSLYGRGLAKLRKGLAAEGEADLAAAAKIDPELPRRAKRLGLLPQKN